MEDLIARKDAALAKQQIEDHEDHCAERWGEARDEMKNLRALFHRFMWAVLAGQGALLLLLGREYLGR